MTVYRLTGDTAIRSIKPAAKPVKHSDSGGLYLLQQPTGGKLWRMDYRHAGKRKTLALGAYPAVSLKDARVWRDEAKKLLANGQDPGEVKKARKAAIHAAHNNSFEAVARAWFEKWETEVTTSTAKSQKERLAEHITPVLGQCPVADVDAQKVLAALKPLETRGTGNTLRKAKMAISQIMDFAIQRTVGRTTIPSLVSVAHSRRRR